MVDYLKMCIWTSQCSPRPPLPQCFFKKNYLNWLPIHIRRFHLQKSLFPDIKMFGNTGSELPKASVSWKWATVAIWWWDMPTSVSRRPHQLPYSHKLLPWPLLASGPVTHAKMVSRSDKGSLGRKEAKFLGPWTTWAMSRPPQQRTEDIPYPERKLKLIK